MSEKTTDFCLKYEELQGGKGEQAATGYRVCVACTGWLFAVAG